MNWDERFAGADYVFGTEPNAFLRRQAPLLTGGGTALAVADGEGRNGVWLAQQGYAVTAVDASAVGLAKSARLAQARGVQLQTVHADLAAWRFPPAAFDVVVGIFFQFATPDVRSRLFASFKDTLRPGGLLLIEGYRPEQLAYATGGPGEIEQLYTSELLRTAFADLEIIQLTEYDAELAEGSRHTGMSALVCLVARKPLAA